MAPVSDYSDMGAFLSLYVTLLKKKVVAAQRLFSPILTSEYKDPYPFKNWGYKRYNFTI